MFSMSVSHSSYLYIAISVLSDRPASSEPCFPPSRCLHMEPVLEMPLMSAWMCSYHLVTCKTTTGALIAQILGLWGY